MSVGDLSDGRCAVRGGFELKLEDWLVNFHSLCTFCMDISIFL